MQKVFWNGYQKIFLIIVNEMENVPEINAVCSKALQSLISINSIFVDRDSIITKQY